MPAIHKLSHKQVENASPGKYSDGAGLWLHKRPDGGGQWFLRVTVHGRRREMGLGSISEVSLKEARLTAEKWRAFVRQGVDPIKERERQRREAAKADRTLATVAEEAFEARKAELRDDGRAGRWFTPLKLHILPKLGGIPVEEIDQRDIKNALAPIWHTKADTAQKALNRLGITLRYAAAMGLDVDIQGTDKARALLGQTRHVAKNIPSIPWQEVPAFYESLDEGTITQLALRLLILTGLRSKPVRFCRLDEIEGDVWTVPPENMKSRRGHESEFRVPLSSEALQIIEQAKPFERGGFLFPSQRKGVISDATMSRFMERLGLEARPHGFRSSFRTWCAEATDTPEQVAETALAHVTGSKVQRAYRRTDFLEQRRVLMQRWADYVTGGTGQLVRLAQ